MSPEHSASFKILERKIGHIKFILDELGKLNPEVAKEVKERVGPVKSLEEAFEGDDNYSEIENIVKTYQSEFGHLVYALRDSGVSEEVLNAKAKELGEKRNFKGNAREAFYEFNSIFLDGMPDEWAIRLEVLEDDFVGFVFNSELLERVYSEGGTLHNIGLSWLEGLLENSDLTLVHEGSRVEFVTSDFDLADSELEEI